ncbi:succinic semialdehyde dehydrogenase [Demequina aurantiaca]|uniref:succinic semialdehyde dehydrogenase n=1 Tax=Demequina aurantiaca TaxID=676200 RepID=UPI000A049B38|nr:succinic semialdehyde dehydrogenase [Demequina aurantiaca]
MSTLSLTSAMNNLAALVTSSGEAGDIVVRSPFDDGIVGTLPASSEADVARAFAQAAVAQTDWAARPVKERAAVVARFRDLLLRERDALVDCVQAETGKARASAFEEVADASLWSSYNARHASGLLREKRRQGTFPLLTKTHERHVPKGVVGVITPWNYPLTLPASDVVPALVTGNAVVLKPDSQTPHTALMVLDLLLRAGLPRDVLQIVVGPGPEVGGAVVANADYVMFTGSTATGKIVAAQCAERLIGCSAELGGKNAMLVLEDADVAKAAVGAVRGCFANSGQLCVSIERIYVHDAVWDEFVSAFGERVRQMRLEPGFEWDADMGSLISERQLDAVAAHVDDAVAKGASVLTGGNRRPDLGPYFYEPTVLLGVTDSMELARKETFGPVVSLYRVSSDDEGVKLANDSEYGLSASVWSKRNGPNVARKLEAGTVNVNEAYAATWSSHGAPMGGMKSSGLGRRHGAQGLLKYTEPQTIAVQRLLPIAGPADLKKETWAKALSAGSRLLNLYR